MIRRSRNRSLQRISRKNEAMIYRNIIRTQTVLNEAILEHTNEKGVKLADCTDLNLETKKVMDSFLHNALGSMILLTGDSDDDDDKTKITPHLLRETCPATDRCGIISKENGMCYPCHTVSGYREMTKKNLKMRPPAPSITFYVKELKQLEQERVMKRVETLQEEIVSQKSVLHQLTKALTYCCTSENSRMSSERIECERLLLLASHRYTSMMKKIGQLRADIRNGCLMRAEKGTVKISNLSLVFSKIKQTEIHNGSSTWIMCVLSHEEVVVATEAKLLNKETTVKFKEEFIFENLLNDFCINVQIYTLSLNKKKNTVHKQYLKKILPGLSTSSHRTQCLLEHIDSSPLARQTIFKSPDFHLEGSFNIKLDNLKSFLTWDEFANGQMQLSLIWDVESKVETSGFLTVREEIGEHFVWDRRWCFLEACTLKYWNYPTDKEQQPPLKILDLRQCVSTRVEPLDRTICSRPRTFLLEMIEVPMRNGQMSGTSFSEEKKLRKYLFSSDTTNEWQQWCMVVNKNIELLRKWNKIE